MTRHIFDGFAHRPFDPDIDGWLDELPSEKEYPSLRMAQDVLKMFEQLQVLTKENWELKQRIKRLSGKLS